MGELRTTINENEEKLQKTQENQALVNAQLEKYKSETKNSEGLSPSAAVTVIIQSIELNESNGSKGLDKLEVHVKLGNFKEKYSGSRKINNIITIDKKVEM